MNILVTGGNGFVGKHLETELLRRGHVVISTTRTPDKGLPQLDVVDYASCLHALRKFRPHAVINLAGQSMVKVSWDNPGDTVKANILGVANIFQAAVELNEPPRIITIGSGEEYGLTASLGKPLSEEDACLPQNPYAISKFSAGILSLQLAKRYGIKHAHVRAFNHYGPGQKEGFVVSDFASKIARIEFFQSEPVLRVGNLQATRDFLDVRDVVTAYAILAENENAVGIYNVCSGKPTKVQEILDLLLNSSDTKIAIEVDPAIFRPLEVPTFVGSATKLMSEIDWLPARNLADTLRETLDWWRRQTLTNS